MPRIANLGAIHLSAQPLRRDRSAVLGPTLEPSLKYLRGAILDPLGHPHFACGAEVLPVRLAVRVGFRKTMDILLIAGGLVALLAGGEALVRGAVGLAARLGLSPAVIGLTVVGFGTSMPELVVSVGAGLRGAPDIAIGNVLGSNIGNSLLILGLCALVAPLSATGTGFRRDAGVMMAAALALVPIFALGEVGRLAGAVLLTGLVGYLGVCLRGDATGAVGDQPAFPPRPNLRSLLWIPVGLGLLVIGAGWLVEGAVGLARGLGVSEAFIGLSIVAVGTSLPELATGLVAVLRRQGDIALGNIVGSNIFNVLGILSITALITPIPVARRFLTLDLPVTIAASAVLALLLITGRRMGRVTGFGLLGLYGAYLLGAQG